MHKQSFIKIHALFLKILRIIEMLTSIKSHNSLEKFGKIPCVSHNTAYTKGERGGSVVECRTPEREVLGSKPTAAVLCP